MSASARLRVAPADRPATRLKRSPDGAERPFWRVGRLSHGGSRHGNESTDDAARGRPGRRAAATGLAGGLAGAASASAADTTDVVNGPWLVSAAGASSRSTRGAPPRSSCSPRATTPPPRPTAGTWPSSTTPGRATVGSRLRVAAGPGHRRDPAAARRPARRHLRRPDLVPGRHTARPGLGNDTLMPSTWPPAAGGCSSRGTNVRPNWSRDGSMIVMRWSAAPRARS